MKLVNDTYYDYIAVINGLEYPLGKQSSVDFRYVDNTRVVIKSTTKSSVHLDILDIILNIFFGDSTITRLYTDYAFTVEQESDAVVIKENQWHPRSRLTIYACYADSAVADESYGVVNFDRVKNKHRRLHLLVTSFFPVGIVLILLCFLTEPIVLWIVLLLLWLWIFGAPAVNEVIKFKKATEPEYLSTKLCDYAAERRARGTDYDEDTSKTGKIVSKILSKMFKFD